MRRGWRVECANGAARPHRNLRRRAADRFHVPPAPSRAGDGRTRRRADSGTWRRPDGDESGFGDCKRYPTRAAIGRGAVGVVGVPEPTGMCGGGAQHRVPQHRRLGGGRRCRGGHRVPRRRAGRCVEPRGCRRARGAARWRCRPSGGWAGSPGCAPRPARVVGEHPGSDEPHRCCPRGGGVPRLSRPSVPPPHGRLIRSHQSMAKTADRPAPPPGWCVDNRCSSLGWFRR